MTENGDAKRRRGREATTAAILDSAEQLFYERGYNAVTVRDIAKRAGVSHPLVHQYVGSKAEVFRAILARNEGFMVSGAPDNPDLLESASLILRHGLEQRGRAHARLLVGSALRGVPYDRTAGRFEAIERLVELAERQVGSASRAEQAEKDLDPRLVVACVGSLFLGWVAGEPWMRPAAGLQDIDEAELVDGLERVILGILRDHVPGVSPYVAPAALGQLKAELTAVRDEMTAAHAIPGTDEQAGQES